MIVTTINVNGARAAVRERSPENLGLLHWLSTTPTDVVCLQETRADDEQLADALAPALTDGWHLASARPLLKGRSGVAILSRSPFSSVRIGLAAAEFEDHGRYLEVDVDAPGGKITVGSVYVHTSEAETDRQLEKNGSWRRWPSGWPDWSRPAATRSSRRLEHRSYRERHQSVEGQRQEVRVPAQRAPVAFRAHRFRVVDVVRPHTGCRRSLQLVVVAGQGIRQRRRMAHRLSPGQPGLAAQSHVSSG